MLTRSVAARVAVARDGDEGITLMELVVATAVSAILAVMATYFFLGTSDAANSSTDQSLQTSQARAALQQWSQLIRLADSPSQPGSTAGRFAAGVGPTTLTFWADLGNRTSLTPVGGMSKVVLTIANHELSQSITPTGGPTSTTLLLGCDSDSPGNCLSRGQISTGRFSAYYPAAGCPATYLTSAGLCGIDASSNPSTDNVVAVGVTFTVSGLSGRDAAHSRSFSTLVSVAGMS